MLYKCDCSVRFASLLQYCHCIIPSSAFVPRTHTAVLASVVASVVASLHVPTNVSFPRPLLPFPIQRVNVILRYTLRCSCSLDGRQQINNKGVVGQPWYASVEVCHGNWHQQSRSSQTKQQAQPPHWNRPRIALVSP